MIHLYIWRIMNQTQNLDGYKRRPVQGYKAPSDSPESTLAEHQVTDDCLDL
jgi:hypothetical protein